MTRPSVTDEMLMAYVDGELTAAGRKSVEKALEDDPSLAEQIAMLEAVRRLSRDAVRSDPAFQPPKGLAKKIERQVARSARESRRAASGNSRGSSFGLPAAFLASIAFAVGLGAGFYGDRLISPGSGGAIALLQDNRVAIALSQVRMGGERILDGTGKFRAIASFRDSEGSFCREFELDTTGGKAIVAVACNSDGNWDTRFATVTEAAGDQQYAPASSMEALSAWLGATSAGAPLSESEEIEALAGLGGKK
jgi:hypothetical protein